MNYDISCIFNKNIKGSYLKKLFDPTNTDIIDSTDIKPTYVKLSFNKLLNNKYKLLDIAFNNIVCTNVGINDVIEDELFFEIVLFMNNYNYSLFMSKKNNTTYICMNSTSSPPNNIKTGRFRTNFSKNDLINIFVDSRTKRKTIESPKRPSVNRKPTGKKIVITYTHYIDVHSVNNIYNPFVELKHFDTTHHKKPIIVEIMLDANNKITDVLFNKVSQKDEFQVHNNGNCYSIVPWSSSSLSYTIYLSSNGFSYCIYDGSGLRYTSCDYGKYTTNVLLSDLYCGET